MMLTILYIEHTDVQVRTYIHNSNNCFVHAPQLYFISQYQVPFTCNRECEERPWTTLKCNVSVKMNKNVKYFTVYLPRQ